MKVIIVDDERLAIDLLRRKCEEIEDVQVVATCTNPNKALKEIPTLEKDVVFLDIEMGCKNGLEVARKLREQEPSLPIVFITAYEKYAVKAFDVKATDYLLKPVDQQRLGETIDYVRQTKQMAREMAEADAVMRSPHQFTAVAMGSFKLFTPTGEEMRWRTRKVKELFIYLWHRRAKSVRRSNILTDLWGEQLENRAISLMHTTLYQLRKGIRGVGIHNPVTLVNEYYRLDMPVMSDTEVLRGIIDAPTLTARQIEQVIQLYQGDYLEEENYEWAIPEREWFRREVLSLLEKYVEKEIQQDNPPFLVEKSLVKMIELDPYNPRYSYLLIAYYGKQKQLQKIEEVFTTFKKRWYQELRIAIPSDVTDLYEHYLNRL